MSIAYLEGVTSYPPPTLAPSSAIRPERRAARAEPARASEEASALDSAELGARALNAIALIWGPDAKRGHLLEPDAYERLSRARGIGKGSLAEIERAVVAWGFGGIGGKREWDGSSRKRLIYRKRLDAVLRDVGPKDMLELLAELCGERSASCSQKLSRRSSRLRRARCKRAIAYYARCSEHFHVCAESVPPLPEL